MARLGASARMKVRVNNRTLDTSDITTRSSLEEQVMLVWYTAHARVMAADNAEERDGGVQGDFNMHWHVKDLFSCTDDDARYASSRIRQVLKKTGTARCVSVGGAGHSPIWWFSDTLPDNIVTVAEWVTAHHNTVDPQREGYKPTRAEKRLSEREAGEDRLPAPVTVVKPTGDEVTAQTLEVVPPADTEIHEVEVEGPALHPRVQAQKEEYERWLAMVVEIVTEHGPVSGMEVATIIGLPPYSISRTVSVITRACRDLATAGTLVARYETAAEQTTRQTEHGQKGGRPARLFAATPEQLKRTRDTYVNSVGAVVQPGVETEVAAPIEVAQAPAPPGRTEPLTLRERMSDLANQAWAIHNELMKQEGASAEVEDLRIMNDMLEEENDRLREEITALRAKLERARAAFED